MATGRVSSEIIEKERKKILEILKQDPDFILDTLASRKLISEDEYETLEKIPDPLKKTRKLLIVVQRKGEGSCQHFLKCLFSAFPESATTWDLKRGKLNLCIFVGRKEGKGEKPRANYQFLFHLSFSPPEIIFTKICWGWG